MAKRLAVMEVCSTPGAVLISYWWRLVGANGQIICASETFARRSDAKRAMRRAMTIMQTGQYRVEE